MPCLATWCAVPGCEMRKFLQKAPQNRTLSPSSSQPVLYLKKKGGFFNPVARTQWPMDRQHSNRERERVLVDIPPSDAARCSQQDAVTFIHSHQHTHTHTNMHCLRETSHTRMRTYCLVDASLQHASQRLVCGYSGSRQ